MLGGMSNALRDGSATGGASLLSSRYRTWFVIVLLLLSTLNFADRAILSVLAQPIKEDLKLTDGQLGMLQGLGFAIFYSLLGLPIGWLAERVNRRNLIAICVAENDRRLKPYDNRLKRPRFVPFMARIALKFIGPKKKVA